MTEIAAGLQLPKAVVHRVLTPLVSKGFVEVHEDFRRYRLGPAVLALGVAYVERIDVRRMAMPLLRSLSDRANATAALSLRYGWERLYIEQLTPDCEVTMTGALGRAFPLHAGSSSRRSSLPARGPTRQLLRRPARGADRSDHHEPRGAPCRARGDPCPGLRGILGQTAGGSRQPCRTHPGSARRPAASISIRGPIERFRSLYDEMDGLAAILLETAGELSCKLGHRTFEDLRNTVAG